MDQEEVAKIISEELIPSFEDAVRSVLAAFGLFRVTANAHARIRDLMENIDDPSCINEIMAGAGEANKIFPLNQATPLSPKFIIETAVELLTDPSGEGLQGRLFMDPWDPDELRGIPPWMKVPQVNVTEH